MATLCPVPVAAPYNPFTVNGNRSLGNTWALPNPSELRPLALKQPKPGYGCFLCPDYPLGTPLLPATPSNGSYTAADLCPTGFFCPYLDPANVTTYPVYCPPSPQCLATRLGTNNKCDNPQGYFEPMPCPAGFYCPSYNQVLVCPEGSFCLTGSTFPTKCQFLSSCPAGAYTERHYGLLVLVLLMDVFLAFAYLLFRLSELRANKEPAIAIVPYALRKIMSDVEERISSKRKTQIPDSETVNASSKPLEIEDKTQPATASEKAAVVVRSNATADAIAKNISVLTTGFKKGLEGHDDLSMNYRFDDLSLKLATGRTILNGVSGEIKAGRMTAIMGPSGCGKTTFTNVLMGKVSRTSGSLKINNVVAEMQTYRKIIGYVPQDDVMIPELTVRENLLYSARVRLPASWTDKEVSDHVESLLKALNLAHVANSRIGSTLERGISGGQRKRVNIGLELAAVPLSVFLDEPTSGLDSTAAMDVANILKSISRLGLTIVSVIHQPRLEIFEAFDDVLMLAPGGRTAYIGPVCEVQTYFTKLGFVFNDRLNPADVLMDILSGRGDLRDGFPPERQNIDSIVNQWSIYVREQKLQSGSSTSNGSGEESNETDAKAIEAMGHISALRGASFLRQMALSHSRSLVQQQRLIGAFVMEAFLGGLAGFMMGLSTPDLEVYQGVLVNQFAVLSGSQDAVYLALTGMINGIAIALISAPSGVKVFGEEKEVYFREAAAGHSKLAYFIGKDTSVLYRTALASAHFVAVFYLLARPPVYVGYEYAAMFLNFFGIYGMSMIISMLTRRENAPLLAVTVGMIFGVLNGFAPTLVEAKDKGILWLFDIGMNRWASEVLFGLWIERYTGIYDIDLPENHFGYEMGRAARNFGIMIAIAVAYRVVAFVLMITLKRDKQK